MFGVTENISRLSPFLTLAVCPPSFPKPLKTPSRSHRCWTTSFCGWTSFASTSKIRYIARPKSQSWTRYTEARISPSWPQLAKTKPMGCQASAPPHGQGLAACSSTGVKSLGLVQTRTKISWLNPRGALEHGKTVQFTRSDGRFTEFSVKDVPRSLSVKAPSGIDNYQASTPTHTT